MPMSTTAVTDLQKIQAIYNDEKAMIDSLNLPDQDKRKAMNDLETFAGDKRYQIYVADALQRLAAAAEAGMFKG